MIRTKIKILWTLCFLFLLSQQLKAQPANAAFRNLTSANGLPNTSVSDITQDALGFIWIATWEGAYRYDGTSFKRISTYDCRIIKADKKGGIWISFSFGNSVGYYNAATDSIKLYNIKNSGRIPRIAIDDVGTVWVGLSNGIARLDAKADSFLIEKNIGPVFSMSVRGNGEAVFLSRDEKTRQFNLGKRTSNGNYSFENLPQDLNNPIKDRSFLDEPGPVALHFAGTHGYTIFNQYGWATKSQPADEWIFKKAEDPDLFNDFGDVFIDREGNFWLNITAGLAKVFSSTGKYIVYKHNPLNPNSVLPIKGIQAGTTTFIDRQGVLWLTRYGNGISRLNLYENDFSLQKDEKGNVILDALSAIELKDGSYFLGYRNPGNSLYHFNSAGKLIQQFGASTFDAPVGKTIGKELSHPFIFSLAASTDGSVWAGTGWPNKGQGGLNRININTKEIVRYKHNPADSNSIPTDWIFKILEDSAGMMWVSTNSAGWFRLNPKTDKVKRGFQAEGNIIGGARRGFITKQGDVIYQSKGKYFRVNHQTQEVKPFAKNIAVDNAYDLILQDETGKVWITSKNGFGYLDSSFEKVEFFYDIKENKFPADEISTLQIDKQGMVWLATSNGIVSFNPLDKKIKHFGFERGLQGNYFGSSVNHRGLSGKIYFGGTSGINVFDPATIKTNPYAPEMIFTGLHLDGESIVHGNKSAIAKPIMVADKITVSPDVSVISIDFAAIHFAGRNSYQYKLEGFDKDWRDGGNTGNATYTNLSPGKYTLYIKASNWDGVWSDGTKSITIRVLPPWWQTWWAYTIYAAIFLMMMWGLIKLQRARAIRKERERSQQKELEQAKEIEKAYKELEESHENLKATQSQLIQSEKMASLGELTAGIAHEIQNPLNFVNNFSEVNNELIDEMNTELDNGDINEAKAISSDIKQNLEKISHHGKRADAIVKGMLQHSRSSSGQKEPTDINALAEEYLRLAYHGLRAKDKSFNATMKTDFDDSIGNINIIPQDIGRVILNLITNAFYAVDEKKKSTNEVYEPTVSVSTKKINDKVEISVKDNGNGIPENVKEKIFQPFFTTKPTGQGTGLGLSLSYDIIKAHGGIIQLETSEREGSEFIIILPV